MLFYEEHWYDFIDLIAEPYRSMVILAIVVGIVVYVLVVIKRKKSSAGRNKANPGNYVSDEKFMSSLIAARRKREDSRYVGDGSTAIPKIADSGKTDESIWADEGK